jgi:hypothetical protein
MADLGRSLATDPSPLPGRGGAANPDTAPGLEWDTVVRWSDEQGCWWWNGWCERTSTEVTGSAPTRDKAQHALGRAITAAEAPTPLRQSRS